VVVVLHLFVQETPLAQITDNVMQFLVYVHVLAIGVGLHVQ